MSDARPSALTTAEQEVLAVRKAELAASNRAYVDAHPELAELLSRFTAAVLEAKPDDVQAFAASYFARTQ